MRLIDVDALIEEHCESCNEDVRTECKIDPICASLAWFTDAPTVDAVPVVHGRWEKYVPTFGVGDFIKCSACGKSRVNNLSERTNYCPNCGARMDGE